MLVEWVGEHVSRARFLSEMINVPASKIWAKTYKCVWYNFYMLIK
jgi:hypothetical protein